MRFETGRERRKTLTRPLPGGGIQQRKVESGKRKADERKAVCDLLQLGSNGRTVAVNVLLDSALALEKMVIFSGARGVSEFAVVYQAYVDGLGRNISCHNGFRQDESTQVSEKQLAKPV